MEELQRQIEILSGKLEKLNFLKQVIEEHYDPKKVACMGNVVLAVGAYADKIKGVYYDEKDGEWCETEWEVPGMRGGNLHWKTDSFYVYSWKWFEIELPLSIYVDDMNNKMPRVRVRQVPCDQLAQRLGESYIENSGKSLHDKLAAYRELASALEGGGGFDDEWKSQFRDYHTRLVPGKIALLQINKEIDSFQSELETLAKEQERQNILSKMSPEEREAFLLKEQEEQKAAEEKERREREEAEAAKKKSEDSEKKLHKISLILDITKWALPILLFFVLDGFFLSIIIAGITYAILNYGFNLILDKKKKDLGLD